MNRLRACVVATLVAVIAAATAAAAPEHSRLAAMVGLAWTGFNTATHQYEATRIASTNTIRIAEAGGFDEKSNQFELKADYPFAGDTWHQRTVIQPTSADRMTATSYLRFGAVPEWKAVEIKYTRRAK